MESPRIERRITGAILSVHPQCIAPYPPCQTGFRTGKGFPGMEVHKSEQAKTPEEAKAKLGQALRELKHAMEDLAEELNQMRDVAAAK